MSARLKPGPFSRQRHGVALAGLAAFAGALAVAFAVTAGGAEPDAGGPVGSLAVPIEPAAYGANDFSPGGPVGSRAVPLGRTVRGADGFSPGGPLAVPVSEVSLGSAEPLPSLATRKAEPRPASVISAPAASTPTPVHLDSAPAPRAAVPASPPPGPAPAPEPVSPPAPEPAPPAQAPEPPPVDFDDSG